MKEHGWRGDSLNIEDRTWVDYPRVPLETLRTYLANPDTLSPEKERERLSKAREEAISRTRKVLANQPPPVHEQFEGLLTLAQLANTLHEDHNFYIDQVLQHLARRALVEAGRRLARRGCLADAEDVFLLSFDELRGALTNPDAPNFRSLVTGRRAELAHWKTVAAPPVLGTPQPPPPPGHENPLEIGIARFFGTPPQRAANAREIRGNAGSRGKVAGIARVALTLEDATALESGEILVCPTTSASWTPMFVVAAAIVTDSGGILSHCAVVAREFGIPAVVGTIVATQAIQSGQRIIVDGSAGVVTVESES